MRKIFKRVGDRSGQLSLGDYPAMAYVRIGPNQTGAMVDTGSKRTVVDRWLAERAGAVALPRTGTLLIAGEKVRGRLHQVRIAALDGPCAATVEALVPDEGQAFRKGVLLGMDFFQASGMVIDGLRGEAY